MFNPNPQYPMMSQFNPNQFPNQMQQSFGYPQVNIQPTPYQQPQQRPSVLHGRVVNSVEEIMPNEVAMDGSVSLFPTKDYSHIYAKAWNSDGTITTVEFTPSSNTFAPVQSSESPELKAVLERCDTLVAKCDELLSQLKAD